jgi:hypothetical protein
MVMGSMGCVTCRICEQEVADGERFACPACDAVYHKRCRFGAGHCANEQCKFWKPFEPPPAKSQPIWMSTGPQLVACLLLLGLVGFAVLDDASPPSALIVPVGALAVVLIRRSRGE